MNAEKTHDRQEAWLQLALQLGRMGAWDWDLRTNQLTCSEGTFSILGLSPHSCTPTYQMWADRVHPGDLPRFEAALERAREQRSRYREEFRVVWPDGSVHWAEGRGEFSYDQRGRAVRMLGIIADIGDRKLAEADNDAELEVELAARIDAELRRDFIEKVLAHAPVMMVALEGSEHQIVWLDGTAAEAVGLPDEQYLGHRVREAFPQMHVRLGSSLDGVYQTGEAIKLPEVEFLFPDGATRTLDLTIAPFPSASGRPRGVVCMGLDMTEQKRIERQLKDLNETLEARVLERSAEAEQRASKLQELTAELNQAEERERRRLATDLHDYLAQMLVACRMKTGLLKK